MGKFRLGLVGCGDIAFRSYLPAIRQMAEQIELAAVCDIAPERVERARDEYSAGRAFFDYREMLAQAELDGVMVLTSMVPHGPICTAALEAGRHVYVEKVMASELAQADRMVDLAEARGLVLSCAPSTILLSVFQRIKEIIDAGEIGQVTFAHALGAHHGPARWDGYTSDPTWFYQKGAGPLFDLSVYPVQILTQLFGPVRRVSAFSTLALPQVTMTAAPVRGQTLRASIDDTTLMLLDFGGAPLASLDTSYNVLAARQPAMQFYGSTGSLTAPQFLGDEVAVWRQDKREWDVSKLPPSPYDNLGVAAGLPHWLDCIRDGRQPVNHARHGRHVLEVLLACYESAAGGRTVDIQSRF